MSPFCFVVFRPQSLLDFLESRVMKRKSINHCEERSEMERWTGTPEGTCNVLRTFRETHAISAMASSTSRIREKAFRNESLDQNNARDCLQSCDFSGKWTSFLPFRFQLQDVSKSAQLIFAVRILGDGSSFAVSDL